VSGGVVNKITIVLADNSKLRGKVVARNPDADIALLSTNADDVPFLTMAMKAPDVGERVCAIGSPNGYRNTLSEGIVSGIRNEIARKRTLIQNTAPISPGSSGGPLLLTTGQVVGITTKYDFVQEDGRPNQNLNFAVMLVQPEQKK
jgi:S1-C subfamily serine protease